MRRHPERVRSVVLEGVSAPDINVALHFGEAFEYSLRQVIAACEEDAACGAAYPDLETVTFSLIARLDATPATFSVTLPGTNEPTDVVITGSDLISLFHKEFYYPANVNMLPFVVYALANSQFDLLTPLFEEPTQAAPIIEESTGAFYSYRCSDHILNTPAEDFADELSRMNPALEPYYTDEHEDAMQNCAAWPVEPAVSEMVEPVVSDIPALMLSGRFDPVTPAYYADHVLETLSNGYHFVFPTMGHGVGASSNRCGLRIITAFLNDPTSEPDASCIANERPIQFVLPQ
jgi:pimeloyl-ACP methyl ester carboxylesterase